ncbi:MAG: hypothetical protein SGPRY_001805 [Prymnesium sp.]
MTLQGRVSHENFNCRQMYEVLDIIRCFDPSFVNEKNLDQDFVDVQARIKPSAHTVSLSALKSELSKYRTEAQGSRRGFQPHRLGGLD